MSAIPIDPMSSVTLLRILPSVPAHHIDEYLPLLNVAMADAGVTTPIRQAMFLAQTGHESGSFRYLEERDDGSAYEGRKDLGNTQPGDGPRYKGRGIIQLTGRLNYGAFGRDVGQDLIAHPDLVAQPRWAFEAASWFWRKHYLNHYADMHDIVSVTRIINGGVNGIAERREIYARALLVLDAGTFQQQV